MTIPALALLAAAAGPVFAAPPPAAPEARPAAVAPSDDVADVRVWLDDRRDLFRPGDRTRVYLRLSDDAYVAVFHVDPLGNIDLVHPRSRRDDGFLRGRRVHTLGGGASWRVSRTTGIGYFYAIASDRPLDFRDVDDLFGRGAGWHDRWTVSGDPFYEMERIADLVLPYDGWGGHAEDWYSYHVGRRRYDYPRYACYDGYGDWYRSRAYDYGSCSRVVVLLRDHPHYYDTRRYRGARGYVVYRDYYGDRYRDAARVSPRHRYKEPGLTSGSGPERVRARPSVRSAPSPSSPERRTEPRVRPPERQRPTLERRTPERRAEPRRSEPRRAEPRRSEPRRAEPRRSEPRRAEPRQSEPRRSEPRRARPQQQESSGGSSSSRSPRVRPQN